MTPQELKNSILQLAIQGKLVEQRPEEGTAEELYQQIQAEKQKLIAEGKIKKEKPLPEITEDEKPFDIPESWIWVRLGFLLSVISGISYDKSDVQKDGYRILRGGNIQKSKICIEEDDIYLPEKYWDYDKGIRKGDILIVASTGSKAVIGKPGFVMADFPNTMIGAFLRICRPFRSDESAYLRLLFQSEYYRKHIRTVVQGTNINNIKESYITSLLIPLPPLAEQKRIVAKIEELLPLIDRYEKAWSRLEEFNKQFPGDLQKSILQMAIQGKLVEQRPEEGTGEELYRQIQAEKQKLIAEGKIKKEKPLPEITEEEKPFDIPDGWIWTRLGDITSFHGGYAYKSTSYVISSNNQIIRLGNVKPNKLLLDTKQVYISDDVANNTHDYRICAGDILATMTGTRKKRDYFFTLLVSEEDLENKNLFLNQRVGCLRAVKGIDNRYLLLALQNEIIRDMIFAKETGTANQGNIGSEDMKKYILIPLPSFAEQKRIIIKLEELLPLIQSFNVA